MPSPRKRMRPLACLRLRALNGIAQPALRILLGLRWERIIEARRPTFFLKGIQDEFLVGRLPLEALNDPAVDAQFTLVAVPVGQRILRYTPIAFIGSRGTRPQGRLRALQATALWRHPAW